jgi:hypothetical protein
MACSNPHDPAAEPTGDDTSVSHEAFVNMISPNFDTKGFTAADLRAVLKRTHFILFTEKWIYCRPGTMEHVRVNRMQWPDMKDRDLIASSHRPIYGGYRKGKTEMPMGFVEDTVWSQEFLRKVIAGESIPKPVSIRGPTLFGEDREDVLQPMLMEEDVAKVRVKKEKLVFAKRLAESTSVIDLCSPQRKTRRTAGSTDLAEVDEAPPSVTSQTLTQMLAEEMDRMEPEPKKEEEEESEDDVFGHNAEGN